MGNIFQCHRTRLASSSTRDIHFHDSVIEKNEYEQLKTQYTYFLLTDQDDQGRALPAICLIGQPLRKPTYSILILKKSGFQRIIRLRHYYFHGTTFTAVAHYPWKGIFTTNGWVRQLGAASILVHPLLLYVASQCIDDMTSSRPSGICCWPYIKAYFSSRADGNVIYQELNL